MKLSGRLDWSVPLNRIALARERRMRRGETLINLAETNPTRVGLAYPTDALSELLASAAAERYDPEPFGLRSAREALARRLSSPDDEVSADDLVLTASTSEAYSFLFKLLLDPGENVLTPIPSYPLLEHLTRLELVTLRHVAMERAGRWILHAGDAGRNMDAATRAIVVVHPNNPTGSYLSVREQDQIAALCSERSVALISDEVFYEYPLRRPADAARPAASRTDMLSFSLGGLSKSAGLPHWKLGWIRLGGPEADRARAKEALELIADSFLSVNTPVQAALPRLFSVADAIQGAISARIANNLDLIASHVASRPSIELLGPEGGWSAVLRVPRVESDEELVVSLIEDSGVLVQPGYFFDFEQEGYLVVSLLPEPAELDRGMAKLLDHVG